jgi:hypothetical protein
MGRVGPSGLQLETGDTLSHEEGTKLAAGLRKLQHLKEEGNRCDAGFQTWASYSVEQREGYG